ncbi:hypothetical protein INT48_002390 [Thamnidium elegans]|uniref:Uncharacterized protein n=1 Tax=Thamnidium elegans TaxID=101142 RepID=A0A8H7SV46_9FUNG|nr:hypothetical protein INT48_002390 [Thamnidium elegans]
MVPTTTNNNYNITPTTYSSRWIPKVEETEDKRKRSGWTEVVSKHNKRPVYNNNKVDNDPFAGMKSCVNYELEIERLKQIVPKVMIQKLSPYTQTHYSRSSSPDTAHSSDSDNSSLPESAITEQEKARFLTFVRNWTGDWKAGHNQFMDSSSLWAEPSPWNYHPTASNNHNTAAHYHLWHSQPVQNQSSYNHWQNQQPTINRHGQHPIGMGRKKH